MAAAEIRAQGTITLILGGVRSGKSRFGQELAWRLGDQDVLFVATAESRGDEMDHRIQLHQRSRPSGWRTLERPLQVGQAIEEMDALPSVVLLDCLTLLVSNVLLKHESLLFTAAGLQAIERHVQNEVAQLLSSVALRARHLIVVSGEVGMGIVPESKLGRVFRDLLGWSNQHIAAQASSSYLMVAGLAVPVSKLACSVEQAASVEQVASDLLKTNTAGAPES
jgi:adenosylcobinamide kinase / adenosylcobinamide-phosphate guanylyltransferase